MLETTTGGNTGNYEAKYNQNSSSGGALEEDDIEIDGEMEKLSKFTKLISPLFLVFFICD